MSKTTLPQQSYELRDYQQELIQKVFTHWGAGDRRLLMQLPTGGGKTVVVAAVAQQFTQRGERVLFLAHREELLLQAKEKLEAVTSQPAGLIKAGYPTERQHRIQIASVQSLIRRQHWFEAGLVLVDEAHHSPSATYTQLLERYPNAYILGVTATPARSDGQGFKNQYDALILGRSMRELIDAGYLCDFKLFAAKNRINTAGLKVTGGDFNSRALAERVNTTLMLGDVVGTWKRYALGRRTVIFCVDIAHSKAVANAYWQAGYAAEHIDGETPDAERQAILKRFRTGETLILANCGIFAEGLDVPGVQAVQCLRPTRSVVLYLQMLGRGLRPAFNKDRLIVLDHSENWIYHGLPDEEREWSLDPVSLTSSSWTIECPDCQHCFRPLPHEQQSRVTTCPNCFVVIQLEEPSEGKAVERVIEHEEGAALEEINLEINPVFMAALQRLKDLQQQHGYKAAWVYFQLIEQFPNIGLTELRECAKILGYKSGWAWYRWQELQQRRAAS